MLNPDYREMLFALNDAGVEFIVVGAFALAAQGNPRSTGDIDIYVRPSNENATRVLNALGVFGAPLENLSTSDFLNTDTVIQIGVVPRRIDIMTGLDGIVDFDEAWSTHLSSEIDGLRIPVLGKNALIRNKKAVGRPQDLADVAWLEANK